MEGATTTGEAMFLPFMLRLLGGAAFPLCVLSVLSTPVFGIEALSLPRRGKGPVGLSIGLMVVRTAIQVCVWLTWAAYCSALAFRYASSPGVDCEHHSAACRGRSVTLVGAGGWWPDPQLD